MQIQKISQNLTTFKSNWACKKNEQGEILNRNTTFFFRNDLDWFNLARFIDKKFQDERHVNIYDFACSDGSETYSLALALKTQAADTKKFFPIVAKDIDENMIKSAQSGEVEINNTDFVAFSKNRLSVANYFDIDKNIPIYKYSYKDAAGDISYNFSTKYKAQNFLKKNCEFECGDIRCDALNIDKNRKSVVLFRNAWPYLKENERIELAKNLKENMQKGSLLIIGDYDILFERDKTFPPLLLIMNGFKIVRNEDLSRNGLIYERI